MELRAFKQPYRSPFVAIWIDETRDGVVYTAKSLEMRKVEEDEIWQSIEAPPINLLPTDAQKLMDDLWNCGLRPSEGTGSAGALAATQKHLEDMRKIVFDKIMGKEIQ